MSLGGILDVAIALVFIYFLLALIASGIQEVIAGVFAWRGTYLSKGLGVILDNDSAATFAWDGVRDFLKAHFTPGPCPSAGAQLQQKIRSQPGGATAEQEVLQRVLSVQTHPLLRSVPSSLPSYVPARNFSLAFLETLHDGSKAPIFSQAERTVAALPEGNLKKTLTAFLEDAGGDLDAFRAHLERWFDDAMDRLSGIYARLSQYVMLILGVVLAIGLNVDSIHVARTLWEAPAMRAAIVANATTEAGTSGVDPKTGLPQAVGQLAAQPMPFGWEFRAKTQEPNFSWSTIPGWIISVAAIALGAPFWFSLLQNLVNMRNAGPKPKRSDHPAASDGGG